MNRAESLAQSVLDAYWPGTFPVDPEGIARAAGIEVRWDNPFAIDDTNLRGASGCYVKNPGGRPIITCARSEPPVRQRFTIAHELGHHFFDHGDNFRDTNQTFNVYNHAPVEVEANAFAAALLMPYRYVWADFTNGRARDVRALAERYGVSQVAMMYRLKNLGIVRS